MLPCRSNPTTQYNKKKKKKENVSELSEKLGGIRARDKDVTKSIIYGTVQDRSGSMESAAVLTLPTWH